MLRASDLKAAKPIIADHLGYPPEPQPAAAASSVASQLKMPMLTLVGLIAVFLVVFYLLSTR